MRTTLSNSQKAMQIFANADALLAQVMAARERGAIDAQQATYILHVIIDIDAYRAQGVKLINTRSETWEDRKRKAQRILKVWAYECITVKRATALDYAGYDVRVGDHIIMFKRQSGRNIYLGERHATQSEQP